MISVRSPRERRYILATLASTDLSRRIYLARSEGWMALMEFIGVRPSLHERAREEPPRWALLDVEPSR
jgi:hypothetical protein